MGDPRILIPETTCWKIVRADRLAFLVDAEAYFRAFVEAVRGARQSVLIIGWDFDSRLQLLRDGDAPARLKDFLNDCVSKTRGLHIHMLEWDFAEIYALERENLPVFKLGWQTHRRFHFHLDSAHPVGASHHQKVVVIDDAVAFVGGFDLTKCRWDTPAHAADESRRVDPDGKPYRPFHDVQAVVSGDAAATLGDLARERWRHATGESIDPPEAREDIPWPDVKPDLEDVQVAVARTIPAYEGRPQIREIEALHVKAIAAARQSIYLENQYLTSETIRDALTKRLEERDGPEVLLVLPRRCSGWLETATMGVLRARLLKHLRAADRFGRLGVYYPSVPGLGEEALNVHSKVMVMDDRLAKVGSANLSNRSMGFDTECDLAVEADREEVSAVVSGLRNRLLAEHLGTSQEKISSTLKEEGSLRALVERLRGAGRTLEPLEEKDLPPWLDGVLPEAELLDPREPIDLESLTDGFLPDEDGESEGHPVLRWTAILGTLAALAAAWRWTPLGDWLDTEKIGFLLDRLSGEPLAPLFVVGLFVVGGVLSAPVTLLIVATALAFGPVYGFAYSVCGIAASAALTYAIGRRLGRDTLRRFAGPKLNKVSRCLAKQGLLATVVVRNIPVAPFTVVNVVAGASHLRFRDFILGTVIGTAPGALAITVLEESVRKTLRDPGAGSFALMGVVFAVVGIGFLILRRWLKKQNSTPD